LQGNLGQDATQPTPCQEQDYEQYFFHNRCVVWIKQQPKGN